MDAFAVRDELGNPIVDNGYLSFICEESDNIVRVDPNQFDFSGSEPYLIEHGGFKYKLYLYKDQCEPGNEVDPDLQIDLTQKKGNESDQEFAMDTEEGSTKDDCAPEKPVPVWNNESVEVLVDLYRKILDSHSFTIHSERQIWEKISEELQSQGFFFSPVEVENRIKVIEIQGKANKVTLGERLQHENMKQQSEKNVPKDSVSDNFLPDEGDACNRQNVTEHLEIKNDTLPKSDVFEVDNETINDSAENNENRNYCSNQSIYTEDQPPSNEENLMEFGSQDNSPIPSATQSAKFTDFRLLSQNRRKIKWRGEPTQLLLNFYQKYSPELGKIGKFTSKSQLWCKISEDFKLKGYNVTPMQLQSRWRSLTARQGLEKQPSKTNSKIGEHNKDDEKNVEDKQNDSALENPKVLPIKEEISQLVSGLQKVEGSEVNTSKDSSKAIWSEKQSELLIDVYEEITRKFNLLKFGSKKYLWRKISQELHNRGQDFTPQQVHSKWKSLQRSLKTKLEKLKKKKPHHVSINVSDRFNPPKKLESPSLEEGKICSQPEVKSFSLPLEVVMNESSDEDSESMHEKCSLIDPVNLKSISESLNKLTSIKENYYRDKILLKEKKLKAVEERTIEIRKINGLLEQFLKK